MLIIVYLHYIYFWPQVDDKNVDAFLEEIGVGIAQRTLAKGLKPRLVISENGGKWTLRSETSLKTTSHEFTPGVEFDDTTADGREIKVCLYISQPNHPLSTRSFHSIFQTIIRFKDGKMESTTRDTHGKEWVASRYINDEGQQQVVSHHSSLIVSYICFLQDMKSGSVVAHRWFKRAEQSTAIITTITLTNTTFFICICRSIFSINITHLKIINNK